MASPPLIELRFLKTVDELDAARSAMRPNRPLLLVVKAQWCERCPAFGEAVADLASTYQFDCYYTDAADTELTEHHTISKLPAYVLHTTPESEPTVQSPSTPEQVQAAIKGSCTPVLHLDADF